MNVRKAFASAAMGEEPRMGVLIDIRVARKRICPQCGGQRFERLRRRFWMRWLTHSRLYRCPQCRGRVLYLPKAADTAPRE